MRLITKGNFGSLFFSQTFSIMVEIPKFYFKGEDTMKVKNLEREIERKFKTCLREFSNLATLYVAYTEKASDKRQERFTDKLEKRYGKELDRIEDIVDIL